MRINVPAVKFTNTTTTDFNLNGVLASTVTLSKLRFEKSKCLQNIRITQIICIE